MKKIPLADLLVCMVCLVWGINVVVVKMGLASFDPLVYNAMRFSIAAILSWAVLLSSKRKPSYPRGREILLLAGLGLIGHTLYQVLFIFGISQTTAGNTALYLSSNPLWLTLFSAVFGLERPGKQQWLGLFVSFGGVLTVTFGGGQTFSLNSGFLGDMLVLSGIIVYSFYSIKIKGLMTRYTPLEINCYTMAAGAIGLVMLALPKLPTQDWANIGGGWGSLAYSAIFAVTLGYFAWNYGLQQIGPTRVAMYQNFQPFFSLLISAFYLGEAVTPPQILGVCLILGGLFISRLKSPAMLKRPA